MLNSYVFPIGFFENFWKIAKFQTTYRVISVCTSVANLFLSSRSSCSRWWTWSSHSTRLSSRAALCHQEDQRVRRRTLHSRISKARTLRCHSKGKLNRQLNCKFKRVVVRLSSMNSVYCSLVVDSRNNRWTSRGLKLIFPSLSHSTQEGAFEGGEYGPPQGMIPNEQMQPGPYQGYAPEEGMQTMHRPKFMPFKK